MNKPRLLFMGHRNKGRAMSYCQECADKDRESESLRTSFRAQKTG
jgi:hypothetical protein